MNVSDWVRQTLSRLRRSEPSDAADRKLEVVRAAPSHESRTADIEQMLHEIMRGYFGDVRTDPDAGNERGAI